MRITRAATVLAFTLALAAPAVQAAPVDGKTARKMLFGTGSAVELGQADFIDASIASAIKQAGAQIPYYGAIAVSPGEPTSSNLMATMANYHSPQAAQKAALDNCNSRRTTGQPCVVIATIVPKRFKPQPLTLSVEATRAFDKEYRKLPEPRALAISPSAGVFGIDRGDGGRALSKCAAAASAKGADDCQVVVFDQ
ncbi:MAG: 5-aminolevulic acid synthase [Tropicimonas sp.]|uniref:5-aminolevulic acid synthase n=1 Tax=Tropicimonas sp. TaxID=2067044 RepID=UPI003A84D1DE